MRTRFYYESFCANVRCRRRAQTQTLVKKTFRASHIVSESASWLHNSNNNFFREKCFGSFRRAILRYLLKVMFRAAGGAASHDVRSRSVQLDQL
jgi:hypothetical protein